MTIAASSPPPPPTLYSLTTFLSLLATILILLTAYLASTTLLPKATSTKLRVLYIWHLFDALIHLTLESSFLYNAFFSYTLLAPTSQYPNPAALIAPTPAYVHFLGYKDRLYGSDYGGNPFALLWQEYARADKRWGGADLGIVSLELLTVGIGGPLALYIAECVRKGAGGAGGKASAKMWFWASVLATGELYGGFMTFAPEWLSGSPNLDTSNFMYTWLYLFFFNALWVWLPVWVLYEAYGNISTAFTMAEVKEKGKKKN
ncbi:hypothetical protein MMC14_000877 [Varicellaria rhodocarpa]|nr:hypothetical protein [Varicellaria rhodocarpa]